MHVHIIVMHVCDGPTEPPPSLVPVPLCCGFVDHFVSLVTELETVNVVEAATEDQPLLLGLSQ